jgi:ATP-dependent DNA helicase RecQ
MDLSGYRPTLDCVIAQPPTLGDRNENGRSRIVDHLLGKTKDAPAAEMKISTFGVGREFSAAGWRDLLDQLQFEGLLREDHNDGRPLITLGETDGVKAVYRGERASRCAA